MTAHMLVTPSVVLATADDDQPDRYCFGCRRRTVHAWQLVGDPTPSYYEHTPGIRCTVCGEDRTCFPGCEWDGPRAPSAEVGDALWADLRARRKAATR